MSSGTHLQTVTRAEPPALADVRVSTLIGDRLCIKCGYNLIGQPILRESHYDMLIVRCPECATVASVQEYPLLGRWANRWASLLAAAWMLALVVLWLGTSAGIFGFAVGSAEVATETYGDLIYQKFNQWQLQQQAAGGTTAGGNTVILPGGSRIVVNMNTSDFTAWWKQQDRAALLREAGGIFSGFNWIVWNIWMWMAIACALLGVIWATALLARGRRGLLVWGLIIILTAAVIGLIPILDWLMNTPTWTRQAAGQQIAPTTLALSLLWGAIWLTAGLMFGRSITRGLIRLMLPPRMRSSLAFLWLADGLEPPTAT